MCNASTMPICTGLVGPKIENVPPNEARSKLLKGEDGPDDATEELKDVEEKT